MGVPELAGVAGVPDVEGAVVEAHLGAHGVGRELQHLRVRNRGLDEPVPLGRHAAHAEPLLFPHVPPQLLDLGLVDSALQPLLQRGEPLLARGGVGRVQRVDPGQRCEQLPLRRRREQRGQHDKARLVEGAAMLCAPAEAGVEEVLPVPARGRVGAGLRPHCFPHRSGGA